MSTQTGTATLVVDNFSKLADFKRTEFTFAGLAYFGIFQEKGTDRILRDNVFVYWVNHGNACAKVHFMVSILSEKMEVLFTTEYNFEFDDLNMFPAMTFMSRAKLLDPKNGYLVNDKLTLLCEAETIHQEPKIRGYTLQLELSNLSQNLQSLLIDRKFSDATLTVGTDEKQFKVHKAILAARSPVFAAMFEHDSVEKRQNEVKITDIDTETCDELLRFIYTGKVKQMDRYALDLLQAADKYQLDSLKNMADAYLCSTLSTETAANVLFVADLYGATKLKDKCLENISANVNQMKDTDGWKALESNAKLLCDLVFYMSNKIK